MRRGLASLIIGLSLIAATVSWAGFTLSRTVLDPNRSERLADQLLESPDVREALVGRLADAAEDQIPPEVAVPRQVVESAAESALDSPEVEALIRDGIVRVHRNALEGNTEPISINAAALTDASRDSLVAVRPELDDVLPPSPDIEIDLPTTGLAWLAPIKRFVDRWTVITGLTALAGASLALIVARHRDRVLRRVAFWGFGAAAFWLLAAWVLPRLAGLISQTSGAIAAAVVDVFFGAMIRPATILAAASAGLLLLSMVWPSFNRRKTGRVLQPKGPAVAPETRPAATGPGPSPVGGVPQPRPVVGRPASGPPPASWPANPVGQPAAPPAAQPAPASAPPPSPPPAPPPTTPSPAPIPANPVPVTTTPMNPTAPLNPVPTTTTPMNPTAPLNPVPTPTTPMNPTAALNQEPSPTTTPMNPTAPLNQGPVPTAAMPAPEQNSSVPEPTNKLPPPTTRLHGANGDEQTTQTMQEEGQAPAWEEGVGYLDEER